MPDRSSALDAAIRALRDDSNLKSVRAALGDWRLARVLALAPSAHLAHDPRCCRLQRLTDIDAHVHDIADFIICNVMRSLVGTLNEKITRWSQRASIPCERNMSSCRRRHPRRAHGVDGARVRAGTTAIARRTLRIAVPSLLVAEEFA